MTDRSDDLEDIRRKVHAEGHLDYGDVDFLLALVDEKQARIEELEAAVERLAHMVTNYRTQLADLYALRAEATAILKVCAPEMDWPTLHEFLAKLEET